MAYKAIYETAEGENATKVLVLKKNEDSDALKAYVRDLKNKYIDYNDAVATLTSSGWGFPCETKRPHRSRAQTAPRTCGTPCSAGKQATSTTTPRRSAAKRFSTRRATKTPKASRVRGAILSRRLYRKVPRERPLLWTAMGNAAYTERKYKRLLLAVMSFTAVEK